MTKEVMKQALEALEINLVFLRNVKPFKGQEDLASDCVAMTEEIISTLEEALNQKQNEPVAMRYDFDGYGYKYIDSGSGSDWQTREKGAELLYTTPQTKEWTDLSVDDIEDIAEQFHDIDYDINENPYDIFDYKGYALALQAKLKKHNS